MSVVLTLRSWLQLPVNNEELMYKYAETGDQKTLAMLYDRCGADLYHFLLALTDKALAEEISQRTWLKLIEKRHMYKKSGRFEAWLFTLGRNLLYDELRQQMRFTDTQLTGLYVKEDIKNETPQQMSLIQQALHILPFDQREAFCLQQEGFGIQEIANMCDCKTETIKSRLRYARNALKRYLEAQDVQQ